MAEDEAAAKPRELDAPEEIEQFRKKIQTEKEALWRKMKETGRFAREEDDEAIRAERDHFSRAILDAKKVESAPDWVQGPRPSDELIAKGGPGDRFAPAWDYPLGWQKMFLKNRLPNTCSLDLYELPSSFEAVPVDANGVPCVWANWPGTGIQKGVILWLHGGGGVMGDIDVNFCARISRASGLRVLTVDYRLAPEHPATVAIEDIIEAYLWLTQTTPSEQVVVYGSSYGGYLVMAFLQGLLRQGQKLPACGVPESLVLPQFGVQQKMWEQVAGNESWTGKLSGAKAWEEILSDPFFNILEGQLQGLPPIYVGVGSLEHVENQVKPAKALAEACQNAGVQVELHVAQNLQHTPSANMCLVPEADAYTARVVAFMHKCLGGDDTR